MADHRQFEQALKQARLAEAAQLEAVLSVKDARSMRLLALRDAVIPHLAAHPAGAGLVDLTMQPGEVPRLWLDLISSVVVAPKPVRSLRPGRFATGFFQNSLSPLLFLPSSCCVAKKIL